MSAPGPATLFDLSGRVALVTGASRGIGFQFAATLAAAGAHVVLELTDDDWQQVIGGHLTAGFRLAREAARIMVPQKFGRIVFTASINSFIARPTITPYVAAKTGMLGLVRGLAVELAPHGITVNAIAPGYFPTEGNAPLRTANPEFADRISTRTPAGRWGELGELATAALYFASPASSYTTGTTLTVDGAMTAAL